MKRLALLPALGLAAAAMLPFGAPLSAMSSVEAADTSEIAAAAEPASVAQLVDQVAITYEKFTLDNGLTVIVHEDRKAPIVAVSVWYGVGSKDEPEGKTGYAHLFEHIMFNGSENAPDDYFAYLQPIGATGFNGSTWLDRTNYYQTAPTGSLESVLFLESDRMGNLLPAVTQEKLDNQIAVVKNEKRQGDNQPYGLLDYAQIDLLFPDGHPYAHPTIGSMEDLAAASLEDMYDWFRDHYGPNNAVIALVGDIDADEARPLMEKWFGRFASGPEIAEIDAPLPTPSVRQYMLLRDDVPTTRITYSWTAPELTHADNVPLWVAADVLGGLASSRLDNILVRDEKLAVSVSASLLPFVHASVFEITVDVTDGVNPDKVAGRLDAILAEYIAEGPSADEVERVAMRQVAARISDFERVAGKAAELAQGELYVGDPAYYLKELEALADTDPADVRAAMQRWLTRPVTEIRVEPGERGDGPYGQPLSDAAALGPATGRLDRPAYYDAEGDAETVAGEVQDLTRMPPPGEVGALDLPDVETATLGNGATVYFARRDSVPVVRVVARFQGGYSGDPEGGEGTAAFATRVMREGTETRDSTALAEAEERLGADLFGGSSLESTDLGVRVVAPNLAPAIALLADIVRNPAFDPAEIERVRAQQLAQIRSEYVRPMSLALRVLPPLLYGEQHPYGVPFSGTGSSDVVAILGEDDLRAFHRRWIRPDNMTLFVVGDTTLDEVLPVLENGFGDWNAPADEAGVVAKDAPAAAPSGKIVVYDRPRSEQAQIVAGQLLPVDGLADFTAINLANDVLGGDFLSRINMELRERRGWTYGARSAVLRPTGQTAFLAYAPVQLDKAGAAVTAMRELLRGFGGEDGVTEAERDRVVTTATMELPGKFETSLALLEQIEDDVRFRRPFDYAEGAAARYEATSADDLDAALPAMLRPDELLWIIVGDADIIAPQLEGLGLPVEIRTLEQPRTD